MRAKICLPVQSSSSVSLWCSVGSPRLPSCSASLLSRTIPAPPTLPWCRGRHLQVSCLGHAGGRTGGGPWGAHVGGWGPGAFRGRALVVLPLLGTPGCSTREPQEVEGRGPCLAGGDSRAWWAGGGLCRAAGAQRSLEAAAGQRGPRPAGSGALKSNAGPGEAAGPGPCASSAFLHSSHGSRPTRPRPGPPALRFPGHNARGRRLALTRPVVLNPFGLQVPSGANAWGGGWGGAGGAVVCFSAAGWGGGAAAAPPLLAIARCSRPSLSWPAP